MRDNIIINSNDLIELLKSDDKKALSYLFDNHYEHLYLFAEKFIYDSDKANDIVQEVLVRIWENRHKLEITTSLISYLFAGVRNGCLDYLRTLHVEDKHNRKYLEAHIDSYTIDVIEDDDLLDRIKKMMEELPPQCREIFQLRILNGYKYKEIAKELNVSEDVVKVQIHRAHQKLKDLFPILPKGMSLVLLYVFSRV